MQTYSFLAVNPETLAIEMHIVTIDETAGLNHSTNGMHRASCAMEHAAGYLASLEQQGLRIGEPAST